MVRPGYYTRHLSLATHGVIHSCSGIRSRYGETLPQSGSQITGPEGKQLLVRINLISIPPGKALCGEYPAREANQHESRSIAQNVPEGVEIQCGEMKHRQPGRHFTQDGDPEPHKIEGDHGHDAEYHD